MTTFKIKSIQTQVGGSRGPRAMSTFAEALTAWQGLGWRGADVPWWGARTAGDCGFSGSWKVAWKLQGSLLWHSPDVGAIQEICIFVSTAGKQERCLAEPCMVEHTENVGILLEKCLKICLYFNDRKIFTVKFPYWLKALLVLLSEASLTFSQRFAHFWQERIWPLSSIMLHPISTKCL